MKYHISINQRSVVENGLSLDLVDMAIVDYCRDFFNSPKTARKAGEDGSSWYWIDYAHLIHEMPILGIRDQDVLARRIRKIVGAGVLERHIDKRNKSRTYLRFGNTYELLVTDLTTEKSPAPEGDDPKVARLTTPESPDTPSPNSSGKGETGDPNSIYKNKIDSVGDTDIFENFWNLYPRKESKKEAEKAFLSLSEKDKREALEMLPEFIGHWERAQTEKRYIPHPSTWIRGRRWEDSLPKISEARPKRFGEKRKPGNALTEEKDYSSGLDQFPTLAINQHETGANS